MFFTPLLSDTHTFERSPWAWPLGLGAASLLIFYYFLFKADEFRPPARP